MLDSTVKCPNALKVYSQAADNPEINLKFFNISVLGSETHVIASIVHEKIFLLLRGTHDFFYRGPWVP
jgi:hypothetical protein